MHISSHTLQDLSDMDNDIRVDKVVTHKEETSSRIRADAQDRVKIMNKLDACVDSFDVPYVNIRFICKVKLQNM